MAAAPLQQSFDVLLNACKNTDNLSALQARFQTLLPLLEMHARTALRKVACAHTREDLVADVITCAWEALVQLSEKAVIVSLDASALASLGLPVKITFEKVRKGGFAATQALKMLSTQTAAITAAATPISRAGLSKLPEIGSR